MNKISNNGMNITNSKYNRVPIFNIENLCRYWKGIEVLNLSYATIPAEKIKCRK